MSSTTVPEIVYFKEKNDVIDIINRICDINPINNDSISIPSEAFNVKFDWLTATLSIYQEQPLLLNSSLPELTLPITNFLKATIHQEIDDVESFVKQLNAVCKVFQLLCRVRGYKHVMKQLTHDVETLEPCYTYLHHKELFDHSNWETKYVLLLWLRMLCLIPFDICSIDSSNFIQTHSSDILINSTSSNLVVNIIKLCVAGLSDTGPTREASAICLSTLLTRPDMENQVLSDFLNYSIETINVWLSLGTNVSNLLSSKSFEIIGLLLCIGQIFKFGHRNKILPYTPSLLQSILEMAKQPNQILIRKLVTKAVQRIGMTFLPPKNMKWRYQRGQRSLLFNLNSANRSASTVNNASSTAADEIDDDDDDDDDVDVPPELDEIFEYLLMKLGDKDTVVRWSASKGIGRLTVRLPKQMANDIVTALLEQFQADTDDDSVWHGCCLALAELARRGALLPNRLEQDVIPIIIRAIKFNVMRGYHSVGAHVRDAACYVAWAFARAYSPVILKQYMSMHCDDETLSLAAAMLTTSLFDREVNVRRAASAAFQENIGRQGQLPNQSLKGLIEAEDNYGLDIIGIADYFSLGNRKSSYLVLAPKIATLSGNILLYLWKHLLLEKLQHWDEDIRVLSSKSMGKLVLIAIENSNALSQHTEKEKSDLTDVIMQDLQEYIMKFCLMPSSDSFKRHGCLLAICEVLLSLSQSGYITNATTVNSKGMNSVLSNIVSVVPELVAKRLYRGKGSEYLRIASCYLIECISRSFVNFFYLIPSSSSSSGLSISAIRQASKTSSGNPASGNPAEKKIDDQMSENKSSYKKIFYSLLDAVNENMKQPHESIQLAAQRALRHLLYTYTSSSDTPSNESLSLNPDILTGSVKDREKLLKHTYYKYLENLSKEENVAVTRGHVLALGVLPLSVLKLSELPASTVASESDLNLQVFDRIITILESFIDLSRYDPKVVVKQEIDPETRRNIMISTTELTQKLIDFVASVEVSDNVDIITEKVNKCYDLACYILKQGCMDYSSDKRGDTGSWSRIEALRGLERLIYVQKFLLDKLNTTNTLVRSPGMMTCADQVDDKALLTGQTVNTVYGLGIIDCVSGNNCIVKYEDPCPVSTIDSVSSASALTYDSRLISMHVSSLHHVVFPTNNDIRSTRIKVCTYLAMKLLVQELICHCLRQLGERLDNVREYAGKMFEHLVFDMSKQLDFDSGTDVLLPEVKIFYNCLKFAQSKKEVMKDSDVSISTSEDPLTSYPNDPNTNKEITDVLDNNENEDEIDDNSCGDSDEKADATSTFVSSINWNKPHVVFPILKDILTESSSFLLMNESAVRNKDLSEESKRTSVHREYYSPAIVTGLVSSIGGLSDGVSKIGLNALLMFHQEMLRPIQAITSETVNAKSIHTAHIGLLNHQMLASTVVNLLIINQKAKNDKLFIPTLKFIDYAFRHEIFSISPTNDILLILELISNDPSYSAVGIDFVKLSYFAYNYEIVCQIQSIIVHESQTTTVITKIRTCIEILVHMISSFGQLRYLAIEALVNLLGHKYPNIRTYVAEVMYLQLISDRCAIGSSPKISRELWERSNIMEQFKSLSKQFSVHFNDSTLDVVQYNGYSIGGIDILNSVTLSSGFVSSEDRMLELTNNLVSFSWTSCTVEEAREQRDKIGYLIDVDLSFVRVNNANKSKQRSEVSSNKESRSKAVTVDELDSYMSLVKEVGY